MKRKTFVGLVTGFALGLLFSSSSRASEIDQSHPLFNQVLKTYVKNARVNYAALKGHSQELDRYLGDVGAVSEPEFKRWAEKQQIAFLINDYNAFTLRLILDE